MKTKLIILYVFIAFAIQSQDLILTTDSKLLEVKIVGVESVLIFYKENGFSEIAAINKNDVRAFNWVSNPDLASKSIRKYSNKQITMRDFNGSQYLLINGGSSKSSRKSFLVLGASGLSYFLTASTPEAGGALMAFIVGIVTFTVGMRSIGGNNNQKGYQLEKINDLGYTPFSQESLKLLKTRAGGNAYFSTASTGIGLKLNF